MVWCCDALEPFAPEEPSVITKATAGTTSSIQGKRADLSPTAGTAFEAANSDDEELEPEGRSPPPERSTPQPKAPATAQPKTQSNQTKQNSVPTVSAQAPTYPPFVPTIQGQLPAAAPPAPESHHDQLVSGTS